MSVDEWVTAAVGAVAGVACLATSVHAFATRQSAWAAALFVLGVASAAGAWWAVSG